MDMMATTKHPGAYTQEYSLPADLESQSWFADSAIPIDSQTHVSVIQPNIVQGGILFVPDSFDQTKSANNIHDKSPQDQTMPHFSTVSHILSHKSAHSATALDSKILHNPDRSASLNNTAYCNYNPLPTVTNIEPNTFSYPKDRESDSSKNTLESPEDNILEVSFSVLKSKILETPLIDSNQKNSPLDIELSPSHNITSPPKNSFCSNELTISSCIPILDFSQSLTIVSSKPLVSPTKNSHPMLTRSKTGHSKPKAFIAQTESERTSFKQALLKPSLDKAMQDEIMLYKLIKPSL
ncbi:unnamed protein product [Vicia faba]|uniref:Uncharacterized protein n=1 Tax=Vicia faba TaxID=3906 RepID=A0AAV1B643_VICFA|nr:unnamed protein product [Vicia faba]